jgi:hypothetical protein
MKAKIAAALPQRVLDDIIHSYYVGGQDWKRTPAIAVRSELNGYIRLNLVGREGHGTLQADASETTDYVRKICEGFASFRNESGTPITKAVWQTNHIVNGGRLASLPDIVVRWNDSIPPSSRITSSTYGEIRLEPDHWRVGHHRGEGFLLTMAHEELIGRRQSMRVEEVSAMIKQYFFS